MKIPEIHNVGAYYGTEENGQWQPNGVIIDNGVGGGVVGSGDAGVRPVYPVHIQRHVPAGYVMSGAFYPPQFGPMPQQPPDFEDYMWMENEEEFDKQVIQELEEEALMEQCIEAMLEDEQRERRGSRQRRTNDPHAPTTSNGSPGISAEAVSRSTLNPLAAEFVPTGVRAAPVPTQPATDTKAESTETPSTEPEASRTEAPQSEAVEAKPEVTEECLTEEPLTPPKDPPEVSAADVQPIQKSKPKDKRPEPKKQPPKVVQELKKAKPAVAKSDTKIQPKKKEASEVKVAKSEAKVEETTNSSEDAVDSVTKPEPRTPTEEASTGFKPINYAAAAKAMKPKPKPTPQVTTPPTEKPIEKKEKPVEKKESKPVEKKEIKAAKSTPKVNKEKA